MSRLLYRALLAVHPPAFRRRFADEMLYIFDQTGAKWRLFSDAFLSLGRQWLLRNESWKVAAALAGAVLQVIVVGVGMLAFGYSRIPAALSGAPIGWLHFIHLTAWVLAGVLLTVLLTVLWFRKVSLCSNSATSRSAIRALPPSAT
jgi:hypothetical protein